MDQAFKKINLLKIDFDNEIPGVKKIIELYINSQKKPLYLKTYNKFPKIIKFLLKRSLEFFNLNPKRKLELFQFLKKLTSMGYTYNVNEIKEIRNIIINFYNKKINNIS